MSDKVKAKQPSGQPIMSTTGKVLGVKVFKTVWVPATCDACSVEFWHCKKWRGGVFCSDGCRKKSKEGN